MREKKGYLILLNSFIRLSEHLNCDAELHFLGSFTSKIDEKFFLNKIASYKNIQFHGFKINSEKNNFFKNSHIFCLPSKYDEGQPISIIEALYAGCAIVSTNSNGIKSMFKSNSYLDFDHSKEKNLDNVLKKIIENQNYRNDLMIESFKNKSKFSERFFKDSISKIIQNLSLNQ